MRRIAAAADRSRQRTRRLRVEPLEVRRLLAGDLRITELMADNTGTVLDGDGNSPDWIELFNAGSDAVDMSTWYLTDDVSDLNKWPLPADTLAAGDYLLVFASGQLTDDYVDAGGYHHTNFRLNAGGEYLALVDGTTIHQQFDPEFPEQVTDVAYGLAMQTKPLVDNTSSLEYLVPTDDSLDPAWRLAGFDHASLVDSHQAVTSTVVLTEIGTGATDLVEIQNVSGQPVDTNGWVVAVNRADTPAVTDYATIVQSDPGLVSYWRLGEQPTVVPEQATHGEAVVDRVENDGWQGGIVYNAPLPNPGWGEDGRMASFTFYNNDAGRAGMSITPLLLENVGGAYLVRGIGTTRSVTAGGVQTHAFGLQQGVDTFDPAAGTFHIGARYGDVTSTNQGVVDYSNSALGGSWTFYGNGDSNQGPMSLGSEMPNRYGVTLNRDYSIEFTFQSLSGTGEVVTAVDQTGANDGQYSTTGVVYDRPGAIVGDADTAVDLVGGDVVVPDDPSLDFGGAAMTVEGWVQVDATGAYQWIVAKDTSNDPTTPGMDYLLGMEPGGRFTFISQGLANTAVSIDPATADGQTWHHVVGVQDGVNMSLYVDGQLQQTVPLTTTGVTSPEGLAIGDRIGGTAGQQFPGTIDEVAVYNRVLSAGEIEQHYYAGRALLTGGVDQVYPVLWPLPASLAADELLYRTDDEGDNYFGGDIPWSNGGPGWAAVVDDEGQLVDLAVWGYTQAELAGVTVQVGEFEVALADGWASDGAASSGTDATSLQRQGASDTDQAADWLWQAASVGATNSGLTVPFPAESVPLNGPIGYAEEDVFGGSGETLGPDVTARPEVDGANGGMFLLDNYTFDLAGQVAEWSFYSTNTRQVTPLIFSRDGDTFDIVGVGQTRTSDGSGAQTYPFDLMDGVDLVEPGYYFGFKDGSNTANNTGVIGWDNNTDDSIRYFGAGQAGNVVAGQQFVGGQTFPRTYSVQMTTVTSLQGEVVTDVQADMLDAATTLYVRYPFTLAADDVPNSLTMQVRYDDAFVAYLNGTQVATRNAPDPVAFNSTALTDRPLEDVRQFETIGLSDHIDLLTVGDNVLAVHLLNDAIDSSEALLDVQLIGTALVDPPTPGYFDEATPEAPNSLTFAGFVADTRFSVDRGFYSTPQSVEITTDTPGATLVYTTDGSEPTLQNGTQALPADEATPPLATLTIDETTVLRAAAFKDDHRPTNVDTHTYVFVSDVVDQTTMSTVITQNAVWGPQMEASLLDLPTVSIVTPHTISQTEQEISMELIYPDGTSGFQVDAGVEHFGGHSLGYPKKSMRISFKREYGPARLEFDVYEDGGADRFDQILLRTGSHDTMFWTYTRGVTTPGVYVRNRWAFDRQLEMGQPAPRGRWVHVYLNGTYWGQHHLMERPNAAFMAELYGGDKEDYDAINKGTEIDGDLQAWNKMKQVAGDYALLQHYLDVENYADYMLLQFYGGNTWDWRPAQNWMAAGRFPKDAAGSLLVDAGDVPIGETVPFKFFAWDSDVIVRTPVSGEWSNSVGLPGPDSLWPLVSQHDEFIDIMADRAQQYFFNDGLFTPAAVQAQFDDLAAKIDVSLIAETARWGVPYNYTPQTWQDALTGLATDYFPQRTDVVIGQLRAAGILPAIDAPAFTINGSPQHGGAIEPGDLLSMTAAPTGDIFYTLDGSEPKDTGTLFTAAVVLTDTTLVKARYFEGGEWSALSQAQFVLHPATAGDVVISEISYHPTGPSQAERDAGFTDQDDFELIELENISDRTIDVGGLSFVQAGGEGITFDFADSTITTLAPGEHVLLARNMPAVEMRYGAGLPLGGQYDGQLANGGEMLTLLDGNGTVIQQFTYDDRTPWPEAADGDGPSLQLIAPHNDPDHSVATNWMAAAISPGVALPPTIADRRLFYDGSVFDNGNDDAAIAPDKTALLVGQQATAANVSSFDGGINGVMIDVAQLPDDGAALLPGDFLFHRGNDNNPTLWPTTTAPDFVVRAGEGVGGADRIVLTWLTGAVVGDWLQVTVRATAGTGVADDTVFYFGSTVGETGNAPTNALVTAADLIGIRNNGRGAANRAPIDNPFDINRDRLVDSTDALLARNHATGPLDGLRLIAPPLPPPAPPAGEGAGEREDLAMAMAPDLRSSTPTQPDATMAEAAIDTQVRQWRHSTPVRAALSSTSPVRRSSPPRPVEIDHILSDLLPGKLN